MARSSSGSDPTTLLALGVIGWAMYSYMRTNRQLGIPTARATGATAKSAQPQHPIQTSQGGVTSTTDGTPASTPPPGATLAQQYNELHDDGWYQVNQWSDGTYTFTFIPPDQYAAYGIPQPNTPPAPAPDPVANNDFNANQGNPTVSPNGDNAVVQYGQQPVQPDVSQMDVFQLGSYLIRQGNQLLTQWSQQQAAQPVTDGT